MGFSLGSLVSDASNILTGGAVNQENRAIAAANPLGSQQMSAYGAQLAGLMANPAGATSTPLAAAQTLGANQALSAGGLGYLQALMQPYESQLEGLSFNSYLKDLGVVSGASANGAAGVAQLYSGEAQQRASQMQQLGSFLGNVAGAGGFSSTPADSSAVTGGYDSGGFVS